MLHKLTSLGLLAFLSLASAQHMSNKREPDLNTKKGYLLYKAQYKNTADRRTKAFFPGVIYEEPNGTTTTLSNTIADNALYSTTVEKKDWINVFAIESTTFPPEVLKTGFLPDGQSVLDEIYSLTALDKSSKALIGSLVFGAAYNAAASGTVTGAAKVVFPVLGATGVFKQAKSVLIEYKTDADRTREVFIYKNLL